MKKIIAILAVLLVLVGCAAPKKNDTFTSASKDNFYAKTSLTGEALWDAFSKVEMAPTVATVNPDGSPNLMVAVPGNHTVLDGKDYFVFGLAPNQTAENLKREKQGVVALYKEFNNAEKKHVGARLKFKLVEDAKVIEALTKANDKIKADSLIMEVVEILPIG
ncbi:MAG: hypothetical protein WBO70_02110 [Erysipelotrichaceae bacterium]